MTYQHIGNGPPAPAPQARRPTGTGKLFIGIAIGLTLGIGIGCLGMIGMAANDDKTPAANAAPTTAGSTYVPQKEQPKTTAPPAPAGPATSIGDGTWTVGVDIVAGTWRPVAAAPDACYWAVLKSGTNGNDIIANDNGGGRPTVTLKDGQDFQSSRCGTWAKQ